MNSSLGDCLRIEASEFFQDAGFIEWLNNGHPKMTWHTAGSPTEFSDVVVLVDPSLNGEGSDSDMPQTIWNKIIDECRLHVATCLSGARNHIAVWLVNSD